MKQFKSLLSIALACTAVFGLTSCNAEDIVPDPYPSNVTYKFQNKIAFSADLVDCFDITLELTNLNGKKSTTKVKNCPKNKYQIEGIDKEISVYVFSNTEETKTTPDKTQLKVKYKYNGYVPKTDDVYFCVIPDFSVGASAPKQNTNLRIFTIEDFSKIGELAQTLNDYFGAYNMTIDNVGQAFINGE